MAWPTTKATTLALDDATDDPNVARPQLKQNVDNVNLIIDELNIGSPSNGDLMRYDGSVWQPVSQSAIASAPGVFTFGTSIPSISAATTKDIYSDVENTFVQITAGGTGISVNSTDTFKLDMPAGSYWIESIGRGIFTIDQAVRGREHNIKLVKTIGATSTDVQEIIVGGDTGGGYESGYTGTWVSETAPNPQTDYWTAFNFQTSVVYASAGTLNVQHEHSYDNFGTIGDTPAINYHSGLAFRITKYA